MMTGITATQAHSPTATTRLDLAKRLAALVSARLNTRAATSETLRLTLACAATHSQTSPTTIIVDDFAQQNHPNYYAMALALQRTYNQHVEAMHALAAAGIPVPPTDEHQLLELGRAVAGLLPPATRATIIAAIHHARAHGRHLRLLFEAQPAVHAALAIPWELIALPIGWGAPGTMSTDDFVLLQPDISLVRQVCGLGLLPTAPLDRPLRLQAFAATPPDAQAIDEVSLHNAVAALCGSGWYRGAGTLRTIHEQVHTHQPQVVHVLCHGEICDTGRATPHCNFLLTHPSGHTQYSTALELARGLIQSRNIQLVVLQACHAGRIVLGATHAAIDQTIYTLLRYGIPAVIAMQGEVAQPAAQEFVQTCYTVLAQGHPIEQAVAAGRLAMRTAGGIADWSLPVLYTGAIARANSFWRV
jgi:hypothetical protein